MVRRFEECRLSPAVRLPVGHLADDLRKSEPIIGESALSLDTTSSNHGTQTSGSTSSPSATVDVIEERRSSHALVRRLLVVPTASAS